MDPEKEYFERVGSILVGNHYAELSSCHRNEQEKPNLGAYFASSLKFEQTEPAPPKVHTALQYNVTTEETKGQPQLFLSTIKRRT